FYPKVSSCHYQHQQASAFAAPPPSCDSRQTRQTSTLWSQVPRLKRASTADSAACTSSKPPFHPAVGSKRGLDFLASPPPNSVGCLSTKRTLDLAIAAPRDHNSEMSGVPVLAPHRPPARPPAFVYSATISVAMSTSVAAAPHPSPPPVLPAFRAKKARRHCGGTPFAANAAAGTAFFSPSSFPTDPSSPTFRRANSACAALDLGEYSGAIPSGRMCSQKQVTSRGHRAVPALFRSASAPLPPPNLLGDGLDAMDEDGGEDEDDEDEERFEDWRNPLAAMVSATVTTTSAPIFPPRLFAARHGSTASSAAPGTPPSAVTATAAIFGRMQVDATPPPLTPPITAATAPAAETAAAAAGGAARQMLTAAAATQSPDSCRILAAFADADAFGRLKRQMELGHLN
ncbi:hypothetical protein HK405_013906, partial [Cladochytrium tenue]